MREQRVATWDYQGDAHGNVRLVVNARQSIEPTILLWLARKSTALRERKCDVLRFGQPLQYGLTNEVGLLFNHQLLKRQRGW